MKMMLRRISYLFTPIMLLCAVGLVMAMRPEPSGLERVLERGTLTIVTRSAPTAYYRDQHGSTGLEYELARGFARQLGVKLEVRHADSLNELFRMVERGRVDLAAAGLSVTDQRRQRLRFSTPYMSVTEQVIYRRGEHRPRKLADLEDSTMVVLAGSSHEERLTTLKEEGAIPGLQISTIEGATSERLLMLVEEGEYDYTLVDSNDFLVQRALFPELGAGLELGDGHLAWAFSPGTDHSLYRAAQRYLTGARTNGRIAELRQRFYGEKEQFNLYSARYFIRHIETRLPEYADEFRKAGEETGFDWRLLAALGYQESLWDPAAVSPTGVRGLMMLTRRTAREMGVDDRTDPIESIHAGAAYLRKLHDRIPERIDEPDRTWMAVAAYNVGIGHVEDARILTQRQGDDPDSWAQVRQRLPLLRQPEYYQQARRGYARGGGQAVIYVRHIQRYYNTMVWAANSEKHQPLQLAMK